MKPFYLSNRSTFQVHNLSRYIVVEELEGQRGKRQRLVDAVSMGGNPKHSKPESGEQDVPMRDTLGVRLCFCGACCFGRALFWTRYHRQQLDVDGIPCRLVSLCTSVFLAATFAHATALFEASLTLLRGHSSSKIMLQRTRSLACCKRWRNPTAAALTGRCRADFSAYLFFSSLVFHFLLSLPPTTVLAKPLFSFSFISVFILSLSLFSL
jgi:hypothetical protein